jgi:hypothetical protein
MLCKTKSMNYIRWKTEDNEVEGTIVFYFIKFEWSDFNWITMDVLSFDCVNARIPGFKGVRSLCELLKKFNGLLWMNRWKFKGLWLIWFLQKEMRITLSFPPSLPHFVFLKFSDKLITKNLGSNTILVFYSWKNSRFWKPNVQFKKVQWPNFWKRIYVYVKIKIERPILWIWNKKTKKTYNLDTCN